MHIPVALNHGPFCFIQKKCQETFLLVKLGKGCYQHLEAIGSRGYPTTHTQDTSYNKK